MQLKSSTFSWQLQTLGSGDLLLDEAGTDELVGSEKSFVLLVIFLFVLGPLLLVSLLQSSFFRLAANHLSRFFGDFSFALG